MDEQIKILQHLPGLEDFDSKVLGALGSLFELNLYQNEALCEQGKAADRLWVLGLSLIHI